MGDNLPPDYVTRVRDRGFYDWPWCYLGPHRTPITWASGRIMASKAVAPDVLIQAHSAPLGMEFYTATGGGAAFPADYRGDAFVALHSSWNPAPGERAYKVVRVLLKNGAPTGSLSGDFLTGFVLNGSQVWGRPVGVAVARDGALLVSDDGNGVVWRVAHATGAK